MQVIEVKHWCNFAKIFGETNFRTLEIPRSGSKAEDGEKKERKKERGAKVGDNNGQATHGARKHAWRTQAAWANFTKESEEIVECKQIL